MLFIFTIYAFSLRSPGTALCSASLGLGFDLRPVSYGFETKGKNSSRHFRNGLNPSLETKVSVEGEKFYKQVVTHSLQA